VLDPTYQGGMNSGTDAPSKDDDDRNSAQPTNDRSDEATAIHGRSSPESSQYNPAAQPPYNPVGGAPPANRPQTNFGLDGGMNGFGRTPQYGTRAPLFDQQFGVDRASPQGDQYARQAPHFSRQAPFGDQFGAGTSAPADGQYSRQFPQFGTQPPLFGGNFGAPASSPRGGGSLAGEESVPQDDSDPLVSRQPDNGFNGGNDETPAPESSWADDGSERPQGNSFGQPVQPTQRHSLLSSPMFSDGMFNGQQRPQDRPMVSNPYEGNQNNPMF
jgi:hypothetical protein